MIRLIVGAFFVYSLYVNFIGSCSSGVNQFGCFKSPNTLLGAFIIYLIIGSLFFIKKWYHLFNHRAHYRLKRIKFGFITAFFLIAGLGSIFFIGINMFSQQNFLGLSADLSAQLLKLVGRVTN